MRSLRHSAILLLALAAPAAFGQAPSPPAKTDGWYAAVDSGPGSIGTLDDLKTYARARLTLAGPIGKSVRAWTRGDLDRTQDGDVSQLRETFAAIEAGAGIRWRPWQAPLSVGAAFGVTFSREGDRPTKPSDPRLWTALLTVCYEQAAGGYGCGTFGQRGPAGGLAAGAAVSLPVKGDGRFQTFATLDYDLPLDARSGTRAQVLKAAVLVRVKRIGLGF